MEKQVDIKHYDFNNYCTKDRWASYWNQIDEIVKPRPQRVLEIGIGDGVVANYIKKNTNIDYKSFDIDEELKPDYVGSIENIKLEDNSFDLVCAFEVLEHLPFEKLEKVLNELSRVAKKNVIISLPHWGRHFSVSVKLPFFKKINWQFKGSIFPIKHKFNGEHYWEIGKREYPLKLIKNKIKDVGLEIVGDFVPIDSPYHHFFILKINK